MINTVVKLAMNQNSDVKAGLALIASTIAAILISNSALSALYGQFGTAYVLEPSPLLFR